MGSMNHRNTSIKNIQEAFTTWEKEYRSNPIAFMDNALIHAKTPGDLAELRAIYFVELLDRVRMRNYP